MIILELSKNSKETAFLSFDRKGLKTFINILTDMLESKKIDHINFLSIDSWGGDDGWQLSTKSLHSDTVAALHMKVALFDNNPDKEK